MSLSSPFGPATYSLGHHGFGPLAVTARQPPAVIQRLAGPTRLMACLLYGAYTHVLNRGPAGVRSPADRMLGP